MKEIRELHAATQLGEEAEERRVDHRGLKNVTAFWTARFRTSRSTRRSVSAALQSGQSLGRAVACRALGLLRTMLYHHMQPAGPLRIRPTSEWALDVAERQAVLDHRHSERFRAKAPVEVYATLLDESVYFRLKPTVRRILAQNGELKEGRNNSSSSDNYAESQVRDF